MSEDKIAEIKERHEFISSRTAAFFFPETAWTAHDDRATLLAEVERLRKALHKIAGKVPFADDPWTIARKALKDKP